MILTIHLLGRPTIDRASSEAYRIRSNKSWGLLAYLILSERPPSRSQLATLLYGEAEDPLRALRWSLAEIRRALGSAASVGDDPVVLQLPADTVVDVDVVTRGTWADAVRLPGLGEDLLEGTVFRGVAAFESWLLSEQRHLAAATEAILHEAALSAMSRGAVEEATGYAVRLVSMNPLSERHHALLIRLYRLGGDDDAATRQLAVCTELFARELGVTPGPAVHAAMRGPSSQSEDLTDDVSIKAIVESGSAGVAAGAVEAGVHSLRAAVTLADAASSDRLRVTTRLALAEALIHSLRGRDEEGSAALHAADEIALASDELGLVAESRAELGYVEFLGARYDRAEFWLTDALRLADGSQWMTAKATAYLGSIESDRANYPKALAYLEEAIELSRAVGDVRREAYALSMLGRIHLIRNDLDEAVSRLDVSIELCEDERWLAFMPWPQTLRGEVELARSNPEAATDFLQQAFARACQLGDPCWEGMAARGMALAAEATGETQRAFEVLVDARTRCNRFADPYVWLDVYILDALCDLGRRHGHTDTKFWIESMHELSSRTGMKEFTVRSLLHLAAMGNDGDGEAARLLGSHIDNPALVRLLEA